MPNFLMSWWGMLVGGGLVTFIAVVVVLRWAGVSAQPIFDFLGPILKKLGEISADLLQSFYDSAKAIPPKGWFAVVVMLSFTAGFVYLPTRITSEKRGAERQVRELRRSYRFVPKPKEQSPGVRKWVPSPFGYGAK